MENEEDVEDDEEGDKYEYDGLKDSHELDFHNFIIENNLNKNLIITFNSKHKKTKKNKKINKKKVGIYRSNVQDIN